MYGIHDLEAELDRRTWHWLLARAYPLLDEPSSLTRREARRVV